MFFGSWTGLLRVLVVGGLAYAALVLMLRFSGKRTLSKLNAFDLVVTVALGSTLATVLLSKEVALAEGVLAFGILICAQYVITALSVRFAAVRRMVKAEPRLLAHRGKLLKDAMREERITEEEILAVLRGQGCAALEEVGAVVLETDSSLSVLPAARLSSGTALHGVKGSSAG